MKNHVQIQNEVAAWSQYCFGNQPAAVLGVKNGIPLIDWVAPLLGMQEELGELACATTQEAKWDAVGDFVIYLCDFGARIGMQLAPMARLTVSSGALGESAYENIAVHLGQLTHVCLKRLQGIRGYGDVEKFNKDGRDAFDNLLGAVVVYCKHNNVPFLPVLNDTWKQVQERDWTEAKLDGVTTTDA